MPEESKADKRGESVRLRKRFDDEKDAFETKLGCTKFFARQNHQHKLEATANANTVWSNGGNRV